MRLSFLVAKKSHTSFCARPLLFDGGRARGPCSFGG
jgi:hypothetical protein